MTKHSKTAGADKNHLNIPIYISYLDNTIGIWGYGSYGNMVIVVWCRS